GAGEHVWQKIGAANAYVDDLDAELPRLGAQDVAYLVHHGFAFLRQRRLEGATAVGCTQRRIQPRLEPLLRKLEIGADGLAELARIDDAQHRDGIDEIPPSVDHLDTLVLALEEQHPVLDVDQVLEERQLQVQPRVLDRAPDLAESHDQRLFALVDDEGGRVGDDGRRRKDDEPDRAQYACHC